MIDEVDILKTLREIYDKKGMNYSFKCKNIAKKLKTNTYTISRHIHALKENKIVKIKDRTSSGIIYETCF